LGSTTLPLSSKATVFHSGLLACAQLAVEVGGAQVAVGHHHRFAVGNCCSLSITSIGMSV
jgi:hypothetical protein